MFLRVKVVTSDFKKFPVMAGVPLGRHHLTGLWPKLCSGGTKIKVPTGHPKLVPTNLTRTVAEGLRKCVHEAYKKTPEIRQGLYSIAMDKKMSMRKTPGYRQG